MPQPAFNSKDAVTYGHFVSVAYKMYGAAPKNPTPPPIPIPGYEFLAWIDMQDFLFDQTDYYFYGFIARDESNPGKHILALRGTQSLVEWIDDFASGVPVPWTGFGKVGYGFDRIYKTMRIVPHGNSRLALSHAALAARPFEEQVAELISAPSTASLQPTPGRRKSAAMTTAVVGHSLGAALATLYVAANSRLRQPTDVPSLWTFASPRVGNATFARRFDSLGLKSWRIVNALDLVPKLPVLGFQHVATEEEYNSGFEVRWTLGCWHSLDTYLHLLDPDEPIEDACRTPFAMAEVERRPQVESVAPAGFIA